MIASFIIPVRNNLELTKKCIESLHSTVKGIEYETILIDDQSDPPTASYLQTLASASTHIIRNETNLGYAKSNNKGARLAKGEFLFLLNNDLVLLPGWLAPMLQALGKPHVGIVGNIQLDATSGKIDHAGFLFDGNGTLRHKRTPNRRLCFTPRLSQFHAVTGACLGIKRELYHNLGGLDEAFNNGCEDIDLCFKASLKGLKTVVANRSTVTHRVSSTRIANNLRDEQNARILQNRWSGQLSGIMAREWPRSYLEKLAADRSILNWRSLFSSAIRIAFPKIIAPSPIGKRIAESKFARNERHWKSILDGKSDDMIKESYITRSAQWTGQQFSYSGLEANRGRGHEKWIKEYAELTIFPSIYVSSIGIQGELLKPSDDPETQGELGLAITVNRSVSKRFFPLKPGPFQIRFDQLPTLPGEKSAIRIDLIGVSKSNAYAYLGRVTRKWFLLPRKLRRYWKRFKEQKLNQRLLIEKIALNDETLLDFVSDPSAPANFEFLKKYGNIGINLVGWFDAELGIGESARLAAKALDTTSTKTACVPLKVNCLASRGDQSFAHRLADRNPHSINVFHIDPPQSGDIDHHHGESFRKHRRNIAYWAWELPEFPERWIPYFQYFDEIWTPSNFVRDAISLKSPLPVVTIPHCIKFSVPNRDFRERFKLPKDQFLFLFAYDLNSYQERKNPRAVIRAFKLAFEERSQKDVGLVIKTHSSTQNPDAFKELQQALSGIKNVHLINETLSREEVYGLMSATDSYVSLHRSEGFGLTVAESMYLGKPVISTDWSATSEFLNASNGCPVKADLIHIEVTQGPYEHGQLWADPHAEHAAEYMQRLVSDTDYREKTGRIASQDIKRRFSPEAIGKLYEKRLKAMSLWS